MAECYTLAGSSLNLGMKVELNKAKGVDNARLVDLGFPRMNFYGNITNIPGPWMYLRFRISELDFGGVFHPKLHMEPVGFIEGQKPLWQRFFSIFDRQDEVWRLGSNDNLILVDKNGAIRVFGPGSKQLYEPTPEQVYEYFWRQQYQTQNRNLFEKVEENLSSREGVHRYLSAFKDEETEVDVFNLRKSWSKMHRSMISKSMG